MKLFTFLVETFKLFLNEFMKMDDKTGDKTFKYREQLTRIAHREQIAFVIDLDDLQEFDADLASIVAVNTRRYVNLLYEVYYTSFYFMAKFNILL